MHLSLFLRFPSSLSPSTLFLSCLLFFLVHDASAAGARAHIKACSGHFRRRGGMRPFHQDIRYAICSLRVPSRVIFPVLVGTTTASRNALRLASADVYVPRRRRRRNDTTQPCNVFAICARTQAFWCTCARVHACVRE